MSKNISILSISGLTVVKKRKELYPFHKKGKKKSNVGFLVRNMNITINRNRIHGIVGESGSGKSLTMKCVLGLIDFSPGIISGKINYFDEHDRVEILPISEFKRNRLPWCSWIRAVLNNKNIQYKTEYFKVSQQESFVELSEIPILDSINVFLIDSLGHCIKTDYIPPSSLSVRLVKLKHDVDENKIVVVSYKYVSHFSSHRLKGRLDKIQQSERIRGNRISMILQDPQTFLNPFWSIDKQLKNIIRKQRTHLRDSLYIERNFTLRVVGSEKDYPLKLTWDKENINRHLRHADLWIEGKSHNMLSLSNVSIKEGSSHFWGIKKAGRQYSLLIHPSKDINPVMLKWERKELNLKVLKAVLSIQSDRNVDNVDLLNCNSYSFKPEDVNNNGFILAEINLIINSGHEFEQDFKVNQGSDECTIVIGVKKGATAGIDTSLGEEQIPTLDKGFYAGLKINIEEKLFMLSHKDVRSPVDLYTAEATLTITPKFDQAYIGKINIHSSSNRFRNVEFGLLSSATNEEDEHLGEIDISETLQEGVFNTGFVIGREDNEILSPKDMRSLQAGVDIDKEVSALLAKVDLNDEDKEFRRQYPDEISGGQGQRVMISLAMAAKPEILIADEPTTGLDVTKQAEVVQLFSQYKQQGRTIIIISHDLNFVSHLADYYTIIYAGTDVEHLPKKLIQSPNSMHPYTKQILEIAKSEEKSGFSFITGDVPDPYRVNVSGCPFEPRCSEKDKISVSPDGGHICKCLFPPMIKADSGDIVKTENLDAVDHFIRCWLYSNKIINKIRA